MRKLLTPILATSLILGMAQAALADASSLSSQLYLEATGDVQLYGPAVLANGARALAPKVLIPEESIVAIDVRQIHGALSASQNSPERVNFPFVTSSDTKTIQRNGKGWVCGLRIVDVTDEDLRETTDVDRSDFCLSMDDLSGVKAMDTNQAEARKAFNNFINLHDLSAMDNLAKKIERTDEDRKRNLWFPIADEKVDLVSPLKGCGTGCLYVTSEFGMRKHPVLKKRRLHKGIDFRAKIGTQVVTVLDGTVLANRTERGRGSKKKKGKIKGYGHYVIVVHPGSNLETLYAHLSSFKAKAGDDVSQGSLIALSGNTGIGTAPHLHFETHVAKDEGGYVPKNPRAFLGTLVDSLASFFKLFKIYT